MRYGGSNPPLCTILLFGGGVEFSPGGTGRMIVALTVIAALAASAWWTMEPGKFRSLCWILLAFFSFRIVLGRMRAG